jgi:LacI family transcriptional regulator
MAKRMARVTLRDVAEVAGVSTATVSNALNRPALLSPDTLRRVQAAIETTQYVADDAAKLLRVGTSRSIGVLVSDTGNPFFAELIRGIERAAAAHGLFVLLANSNGDPAREVDYIRFMESQRARGLILAPSGAIPDAVHGSADRGMPFVMLGEAPAARFPSVSGDDYRGGALAAQHLVDVGARSIAFVGGPLRVPQLAKRRYGAASIARDAGVPLRVIETAEYTVAAGLAAAAEILTLPPDDRPDAVQAGNDLLAIGLLQGFLRDGNVRVPDDIRIIGYDDVAFAASVAVPLSTIRHPTEVIGKTALDLLLLEFDDRTAQRGNHLVFLPELIQRESTAVARQSRAAEY